MADSAVVSKILSSLRFPIPGGRLTWDLDLLEFAFLAHYWCE